MKKILFISHTLPPYLYPQSIQVGRFLQELKKVYDVHIICDIENTPPDPSLYPDLFDGIAADKILKIPFVYQRYRHQIQNRLLPLFFKRPDIYKSWAEKALAEATAKFSGVKFDAIVTFSFPLSLNLLGQWLKDHFQCKWIAHQSDPWADNPFMHYGPLTRRVNRGLERKAFTAADRLVFTNEEAARFYQKKYAAMKDKITFIDHSFDPALYDPAPPAPSDRKTVRYVGSFYAERTAGPLLDALRRLSPQVRGRLRFEIVGANLKTRLMIQKANLPVDLIGFTGRVNYGESLRLMSQSDVLLVIDAPHGAMNIFFPSKLADYIGANRPMIGISPPGPSDRILKSLGYHCYRHDQVAELAEAFENIAAGRYMAAFDAGDRRENYLCAANARKLSEVIDNA
ncbi:MAG: hypothetical protein JWO78_1398 [Micavibrio sp.]|nr:hypothetical protein [Micavibrio sp.]